MGAPVYCVYCVFLCGTNKLEPKKPDALAGYSLCTAALSSLGTADDFFPQNDAFTDRGTD